MERRIPVSGYRVTAGLVSLLLLLPVTVAAERTVVLVTGESCPIERLAPLNVRKAYLGVAVTVDSYHIVPLRLTSDKQLNRVFFQSIVAMSRKSYERRAVSLALRFGTPRPIEIDNLDMALRVIRRIECSIVYAWSDDILEQDGIKVLQPLWQGE